jgi:hypothetical protein
MPPPLEPWIIEEIRRREQEERRRKEEQPQIPLYDDPPPEPPAQPNPDVPAEKKDRGVVIINPDGEEENGSGTSKLGAIVIQLI